MRLRDHTHSTRAVLSPVQCTSFGLSSAAVSGDRRRSKKTKFTHFMSCVFITHVLSNASMPQISLPPLSPAPLNCLVVPV